MIDTACLHQEIGQFYVPFLSSKILKHRWYMYMCLYGSQCTLLYSYFHILKFHTVGCRSVRVYFTPLPHCPPHPTRDTRPAVMEVHQFSPKSQLPCQQICRDSSKKNLDLETSGWILWFCFSKLICAFAYCLSTVINSLFINVYQRTKIGTRDFKLKKIIDS